MSPVTFLGDSLEAIRNFPHETRREAGLQLDRVQRGLMPERWQPMKTVGPGVNEIRVRESLRSTTVSPHRDEQRKLAQHWANTLDALSRACCGCTD